MKHLTHLHEQVEARRNRVKNTAFMNELREHNKKQIHTDYTMVGYVTHYQIQQHHMKQRRLFNED